MQTIVVLTIFGILVQNSVAPPVTEKKQENPEDSSDHVMEYQRYLQEVVSVLESDPEFRKKLETVNETDIRNGKIAYELEIVGHNVRTRLDELKREEVQRLSRLATRQYELNNGFDLDHPKIPGHLDHQNPHTFEVEDLKKLIEQVTKDLNEADKKRREEFKAYEMQKKFEEEQKKKAMNEEEKKKYEEELKKMKEKHKQHEPLHMPGSKQQLEEVWEKQDHMENQEFDPKIFFHLHDLDGNGVWDQNEVKALFIKELNKMYEDGHPEDDIRERAEEMERMREHVFNDADLNKDGLLSFDEFMAQSKKPEFQKDPGWDGLDEQQLFSESEYESYLKQKELERHLTYDVQNSGQPHPGMNQAQHPAYAQQQQYQQAPQYHGQPNQNQYLNLPPQVPYDNRAPQYAPQYNQHVPPQQYQNPGQPAASPPVTNNQVPSQQYQAAPPQPQYQQYQNPPAGQPAVPNPQAPQYQQQYQNPPGAPMSNQQAPPAQPNMPNLQNQAPKRTVENPAPLQQDKPLVHT